MRNRFQQLLKLPKVVIVFALATTLGSCDNDSSLSNSIRDIKVALKSQSGDCLTDDSEFNFYEAKENTKKGDKVRSVSYTIPGKTWRKDTSYYDDFIVKKKQGDEAETKKYNQAVFVAPKDGKPGTLFVCARRSKIEAGFDTAWSAMQYPDMVATQPSELEKFRETATKIQYANFVFVHGKLSIKLNDGSSHDFMDMGFAMVHTDDARGTDWQLISSATQCFIPKQMPSDPSSKLKDSIVCPDQNGDLYQFYKVWGEPNNIAIHRWEGNGSLVKATQLGDIKSFGDNSNAKLRIELSKYAIDNKLSAAVKVVCPVDSGFIDSNICNKEYFLRYFSPKLDLNLPPYYAKMNSVNINNENFEFLDLNPAKLELYVRNVDSHKAFAAVEEQEFNLDLDYNQLFKQIFAHVVYRMDPKKNYYRQCDEALLTNPGIFDNANCDIDFYLVRKSTDKVAKKYNITEIDHTLHTSSWIYDLDMKIFPYEIRKTDFTNIVRENNGTALTSVDSLRIGEALANTKILADNAHILDEVYRETYNEKTGEFIYNFDDKHPYSTYLLQKFGINAISEEKLDNVASNMTNVGNGNVVYNPGLNTYRIVAQRGLRTSPRFFIMGLFARLIREIDNSQRRRASIPVDANFRLSDPDPMKPPVADKKQSGKPTKEENVALAFSDYKVEVPTKIPGGKEPKRNKSIIDTDLEYDAAKSDPLTATNELIVSKDNNTVVPDGSGVTIDQVRAPAVISDGNSYIGDINKNSHLKYMHDFAYHETNRELMDGLVIEKSEILTKSLRWVNPYGNSIDPLNSMDFWLEVRASKNQYTSTGFKKISVVHNSDIYTAMSPPISE